MNKVYDNGEIVLGTKKDLIKYFKKCIKIKENDIKEEIEEINSILQDIEEEKENTILAINYDNGMGYSIDYWYEDDVVGGQND